MKSEVKTQNLVFVEPTSKKVFLTNRKECTSIPFKDILYIQKSNRKVEIKALDGMHYYYGKVSDISQGLDDYFYACLKFLYVNLNMIKCIADQTIIFVTGEKMILGRDCFVHLKQRFRLFVAERLALEKEKAEKKRIVIK